MNNNFGNEPASNVHNEMEDDLNNIRVDAFWGNSSPPPDYSELPSTSRNANFEEEFSSSPISKTKPKRKARNKQL